RAGLGEVAGAGRGPAHGAGRLEGVGRTAGAGASAGLGRVAHVGRGAADGRGGLEAVGRAVVVRAVTALGDVADAGRRAADRRALGIGGAAGAGAGAGLRGVADAGRGAAHRRVRGEAVGRAVRAHAGTGLGGIAGPRRRPAHRARVTGRVLARIAAAVALIERARIAVVGARGPARLPHICRTGRTGPRAGLRQVALACGRAARGAGGLERIGWAVVGNPVTALSHVTGARRGTAHRRALRIGRAGGARPRAGLRDVARPGRRTTHG